MNLHDPKHPWSRLTAAARTVRDERDATAPYGFATRVAALALGSERKTGSLFERLALRAVGVSCLLALVSVAVNYRTLTGSSTAIASAGPNAEEYENLPGDDAVAVVLDLSD